MTVPAREIPLTRQDHDDLVRAVAANGQAIATIAQAVAANGKAIRTLQTQMEAGFAEVNAKLDQLLKR